MVSEFPLLWQRLDQWLWHARFCKTRTLCNHLLAENRLRLNGRIIIKPATRLKINDVLTFHIHNSVKVIRVTAFASRRISANQVSLLYEEIVEKQSKNL